MRVEVDVPHQWPETVADAVALQDRLRGLVEMSVPASRSPVRLVAGLDAIYAAGSPLVVAAAVVLDYRTLAVVEQQIATATVTFDYVPGLLAFRELPPLVAALRLLRCEPDLLVCDGHGIAHPRRFGLACHVGVLTGVPTIAVAKNPFVGMFEPPERHRGASSDILDGGELIGRVVRTRTDVKPVFVSVGHRVDLDSACAHAVHMSPHHRVPEPVRRADHASRQALNAAVRGLA